MAGIQGVRALAAVSILGFHAWLYSSPDSSTDGEPVEFGLLSRSVLPNLALGVTLLFVLSAFLLYRPFAAALVREQRPPSLGRYLRNRALRIFPAYWAILLATALVLQTALHRAPDGSLHRGALTQPGDLLLDATFGQTYVPRMLLSGIGPAWALTVVVTFYLSLPLLVLLAATLARRMATRRGRLIAAMAPALLLVVVGLASKLLAAYVITGSGGWGPTWHAVLERSYLVHADMFGLGLALAVIVAENEDGRLGLPRLWRPAAWLAALGFACAGVKFGTDHVQAIGNPAAFLYDALTAVACAIFLALVVLPQTASRRSPLLVRVLETRVIVSIGVVSYSLFLWHVPLAYWLQSHGLTVAGRDGLVLNVIVLLVTAFAFSTITYRYLERPALLRKSRGWHRPASPLRRPGTVRARRG